ncbi:MAG: uracil-DNA glycosylase [Gammaproteobacteria bacterium]|nr:uracil-DNA glycosylase [Gammaproteobacteria bacterium]
MRRLHDKSCRRCPRLAGFLDEIRLRNPQYHCAPVPSFGDERARVLIVGLAPGMHGANRTGRPFTGDHAGILLYATLHRFGFASAPTSSGPDDGLSLRGARIANAVKCLPPQNKPTPSEIANCNAFLAAEIVGSADLRVIVALGAIAHAAVLRAVGLRASTHRFAHGAAHDLDGLTLLDSYHCSRYNTQTRRLTPAMFESVFERAAALAA